MPNVQGIYWTNPDTGEAGIWVRRPSGVISGRSTAQMEQMLGQGSPEKKAQNLMAAAKAYFEGLEQWQFPLSSCTPEEQAMYLNNPPRGYVVVGGQVVVTPTFYDFTIYSINPLTFNVTVSEGASDSGVIIE